MNPKLVSRVMEIGLLLSLFILLTVQVFVWASIYIDVWEVWNASLYQ